ncbi:MULTISPECIES: TolC family protein [Sphingobacterium]|uniref:TolC family protein n=1 Tax=Sphingobacterium TaxID=28453 RepID=UPI00257D5DF1|nr:MULTISPECIES: TolC family protein [Sphingobacterium]
MNKQHILTKKSFTFFLFILSLYHAAIAQDRESTASGATAQQLDYSKFINTVAKNNLAYAAEKFNLNIAEANIISARVFPDPEFSMGIFDNSERTKQLGRGYNAGIAWTLELGSKRKARINLAKDEAEVTRLLLEDYFRNLRADATLAFLTAKQQAFLLKINQNSYQQLRQLAISDSIRYQLGSIPEINFRQSKLEAANMHNTLLETEATWKSALANLSLFMADSSVTTTVLSLDAFNPLDRTYHLDELVRVAQNDRSDLKVALQNKQLSKRLLQLAQANRIIDLGLSVGVTYNREARNETAPTPQFTAVNAGISIPLKFSNFNTGDLKAAKFKIDQDEIAYQEVLLRIQIEVTQAFLSYQAAQKQVQLFDSAMLSEAKAILAGKVYSYKRGDTSLLEVLNAQRTYNETQLSYYEARYNYAIALVELQRTAGIWDIQEI